MRPDLIAAVTGKPEQGYGDGDVTSFRSASGNIACTLTRIGHGTVVCTIYQHDAWAAASSCHSGPITTSLSALGPRVQGCTAAIPAAVATSSPVLPYGHTSHGGDYTCLDDSAGVTCVDLSNNSGFVINRKSFTTYQPLSSPSRGCATSAAALLAGGGLKAGQFSVGRVRTTSAGPLFVHFVANPIKAEADPLTVVLYCSAAGWKFADYGTAEVGCEDMTSAQLAQLDLQDCSVAAAEPYRATAGPATRAMTDACYTWAHGDSQSAAGASQFYVIAAGQATDAAAVAAGYAKVAAAMSFVSSLPETGNRPADVTRAVADEKLIQRSCGPLGVHTMA